MLEYVRCPKHNIVYARTGVIFKTLCPLCADEKSKNPRAGNNASGSGH